jgi:hypothetical protein
MSDVFLLTRTQNVGKELTAKNCLGVFSSLESAMKKINTLRIREKRTKLVSWDFKEGYVLAIVNKYTKFPIFKFYLKRVKFNSLNFEIDMHSIIDHYFECLKKGEEFNLGDMDEKNIY